MLLAPRSIADQNTKEDLRLILGGSRYKSDSDTFNVYLGLKCSWEDEGVVLQGGHTVPQSGPDIGSCCLEEAAEIHGNDIGEAALRSPPAGLPG